MNIIALRNNYLQNTNLNCPLINNTTKNYFNHANYFSDKNIFVKNNNSNINFCSCIDLAKNPVNNPYFDKFLKAFVQKYGDIPLENVVNNIFKRCKELGVGASKRVWLFPELEDYVVALMYRLPVKKKAPKIQAVNMKYSECNFGEPIATNGYNILIMERVPGVSNSCKYIQANDYICANNTATRQMAKEYLAKLELFKNFPQAAYDDLIRQVEICAKQGEFIDFLNPNNILIDTDKNMFHIIDLFSKKESSPIRSFVSKNRTVAKTSGVYDAIHLLLCPRQQSYFLEQMTTAEKAKTINMSKNVINKVIQASKNTSLPKTDDLMQRIMWFVGVRDHNENYFTRYADFLKTYQKDLSKMSPNSIQTELYWQQADTVPRRKKILLILKISKFVHRKVRKTKRILRRINNAISSYLNAA